MSVQMGNLFIISAPSGAGKSSLLKALLSSATLDNTVLSVSSTTRDARPGEQHGVHYHFVSTDDFKQAIDNNEFFEWAEVFGNYYGTSRKVVENTLRQGLDVFLDIDWQGAQQVKALLPESIGVFILPPSKAELQQRLENRGQDAAEVIDGRMAQAIAEMSHYDEADYLIINDDFEQALAELQAIVLANRLKQPKLARQEQDLINDLLDRA